LRVENKYIIYMAMKTIDFSYFIERYNTGEMDSMEKKWFMKELEGNTTLQEEVKLRKRVDDSLVKHDLIDLRNKLANLEKTRKEKVSSSDGKKSVIIRFAASFAVLMLFGTLYYFVAKSSTGYDKIYIASFAPYEHSGTSRANVLNNDLSFKTAMDLYINRQYSAASTALREYLSHNPGRAEATLILGVSEMENNNFETAITLFSSLCEKRNNLYIDHSQWYLALCYVKTGNEDKAIEELQAIINSGSIYSSKAKKVIRKIK
jgi:tetratricopeptide (TPR) repeat protein